MKNFFKSSKFYAFCILVSVLGGVAINIKQQNDVDKSKLPEKIELSRGFQRWITNMKNKDFVIDADEFRLIDENEVFNSKTMIIFSSEDETQMAKLEKNIAELLEEKRVVFSPSKKRLVDYREIDKEWVMANQVRFYGLKEDKILDFKAVECAQNTNCFFDRAFFTDNDTFAVVEISRNVNKRDPNITPCTFDESCEYTVKIHVTDMVRNSRAVYESKPFIEIYNNMRERL